MTMPTCRAPQAELEQIAEHLRPAGREFIPVLRIADQLGVHVCIRFVKGRTRPTAQIELAATPPTIYLTRESSVDGVRLLEGHDDNLLTPRERFSVAHELGHLVAYKELQISPALKRSDYWAHEEYMHRFAATLLMPGWLLDSWLDTLPAWEPVSPFALRYWARNIAKLSEEVVATQLCLRRPDIGFLKVGSIRRRKDSSKVLRVLFAASGDELSLPNTHSHIDNKQLLEKLAAETTGTASIRNCVLGREEPQDISIVWRHAGFFKVSSKDCLNEASPEAIPFFWISAAFQKYETVHQLALW
jgi:hypothetical protein